MMGPGKGFTLRTDPVERARKCGYTRISHTVSIERETETGRCRYGGLMVCGSIHVCAVCAANIRHRRMLEIVDATSKWLDLGGQLVMVTLTTRHHAGQPLDGLWTTVSKGWDKARGGRARAEEVDRWGMAGFIRTTEVTHGLNGWHPHVHALLFVRSPAALVAEEVERTWFPRWADSCERTSGQRPDRAHGLRADPVTGSTIGRYLAKVQDDDGTDYSPALELARGDLKTARGDHGRTPFGLLDDYWTDPVAARGWREWEIASKGRRAIEWSRASKAGPSLRDLLGVRETSDQDAAERAEWSTDLLYRLTPELWQIVRSVDMQDFELLQTAQRLGAVGVYAHLRRLVGDALGCPACHRADDGHVDRHCPACSARLTALVTTTKEATHATP